MIEEKWLFIGTDKRLAECCRMMTGNGNTCRIVKSDSYTSELERVLSEFSPDNIVFPIVGMEESIPLELLKDGTNLYTGIVSEEWLKHYIEEGFNVTSYLKEELFIWENARLTAEGFLIVYYEETRRTIQGKSFHIAGYGRVGKMVADTLLALGGKVCIIARSDEQIGEAIARGVNVKRLSSELDLSNSYLINTIPAQWFTEKIELPLFIFDLASAPGCLEEGVTFEYYTLRLGLPGKYFPVDAAIALSRALERLHRR